MKTILRVAAFLMLLLALPVKGQISDDFNAYNINSSIWTFVDPLGDATLTLFGTGTNHASASIAIPAGTPHEPWTSGNTAPRLMQNVADGDFEIAMKSLTPLGQRFEIVGILVEQDSANALRVDLNSTSLVTSLFAASFTDGFSTPVTRIGITQVGTGLYDSLYLKVRRVGDQWTVWTSFAGDTWDSVGTFAHSMVVNKVGIWVGNAGATAPALTGLFDYFMNTASPFVQEDGQAVVDSLPPMMYAIAPLAGGHRVRVNWKTDERSKGRIEYGTTAAYGQSVVHNDLVHSHSLDMAPLLENTLYHFRVISEDSTGRKDTTEDRTVTTTTASSPVLQIWYGPDQTFGTIGTPQRWANILGNVSDPQGIDSLYYTLNGGPIRLLSVGPDEHRLEAEGDFNVDLLLTDLQAGANTLRIVAKDLFGESTDTTITVRDMNSGAWPLPYTVGWVSSASLMDSAQVVDGKWSVAGNGVRTVETGYDRIIALGDTSWTDYEATALVKVHGLDSTAFIDPDVGPAVSFLMRWEGHTNSPTFIPPVYQPLAGYNPFGAIAGYHWTVTGGKQWELSGNDAVLRDYDDTPSLALQIDTQYVFKLQVRTLTGQGGFYRFKAWKASAAEPSAWLLNMQETLSDPQQGSLLLMSHRVDATFGPVTLTALPADLSAPVISNIQSQPGATSATITFTTDEPAIGFVVYGATYQDTAFVDSVVRLSHEVNLAGLTPNTVYNYRALAVDASGNLGTSTDLVFTTGAPAATTTLVSDEFTSRPMNPAIWTFTNPDPPGGADSSTTGTEAWISVSAGIAHDPYTSGYVVPRIMQSCNDADFEVEVKMSSPVSTGYQMQGFLVEQDAANILRVDMVSTLSAVRVYALHTTDGFTSTPALELNVLTSLPRGTAPLYMRLKRETNVWSVWYSANGSTWILAGRFNASLVVSKVGLYAGNAGSPAPAHTAQFDYFRTDGVVVNVRAWLQGPYVAADDSMKTGLTGVVPAKNPYGVAPWNYAGGDSVLSVPAGVVDWVLVTLRSGTASTTGIDTTVAFIKKDGSIVGLDGTSMVGFPGVKFGNYYVVLRHRNHLSIMSAGPLALNGAGVLYDFTTAADKAYGTDAMKGMGTGGAAPFALYGGEANGDGQVTSSDFNVFLPKFTSGAAGYEMSDWNLDGQVTSSDFNIFLANFTAGKVTRVP